jgi:hypothetical protein
VGCSIAQRVQRSSKKFACSETQKAAESLIKVQLSQRGNVAWLLVHWLAVKQSLYLQTIPGGAKHRAPSSFVYISKCLMVKSTRRRRMSRKGKEEQMRPFVLPGSSN